MNILFRVDASTNIGTGHVMRCLTLADLLRLRGAQVFFVCKEQEGHLCDYIEKNGYVCLRIGTLNQTFSQLDDASETIRLTVSNGLKMDVVIVDHYQIGYEWERVVRNITNKIVVIDDLANRLHDCDVILDQNFYEGLETRYDELVPPRCVKLLGPQYLILRPEFQEAFRFAKNRDRAVNRILIFFGGSDPTNETEKCLFALQKLDNLKNISLNDFHIDVVVGDANPKKFYIKAMCDQMSIHYHCQINNIAELMAEADLSIGAGGVTMWERMVVGLPSLTVIVADNQRETVEAASKFGAVWNLGWHENVKIEDYADNIKECLERPERLRKMSEKSKQLVGCRQNMHVDWIGLYLLN